MLKLKRINHWSWMGFAGIVLSLHFLGFIGIFSAARTHPNFVNLGLLAYTFGLRHAFDIDHIAAIDNSVRKLIQQRRNPLGTGFYFSLGHSSVVVLVVLGIALSFHWIQNTMPQLQRIGEVIGMAVSGGFILLIGLLNLVVLIQLGKVFHQYRSQIISEESLAQQVESNGLIVRWAAPLFRLLGRSWHAYPLGFLFGLGFDTATEVGLLALSATASQQSMSLFEILSLPILFAAGMSLMDTADGIFMSTAYQWAFSTPLRKIYYNMTITTLSVAAALIIGGTEIIQILSERLASHQGFLGWSRNLDFSHLGYGLVGLFIFAWLLSITLWKVFKLESKYG